jgi:RIO kinase 1
VDPEERHLRRLDSQIEGWRKRRKDADDRKTYDEVFDRATLMTIYKLMNDGVLETLEYPVATGKEGNVFAATHPDGHLVAAKIYRVNTATFRNIARYILDDPRFRHVRRAHREVIYAWATKEFKNLERMHAAGTRVPRPLAVRNNVLVMAYVGDATQPAPMLKDVEVDDPDGLYDDVRANLHAIHRADLVHGDMSEYNLLFWDRAAWVIDCGQAVPWDHPQAEEWFLRDMVNITRYFRHLGVEAEAEDLARDIRGG